MISRQQFTEEITALLPALYRTAQSILRSSPDAQDAVQQSLLKAWEKRASARPESFRAWMHRIVINQCRDQLRQGKRVICVEQVPETPFCEKAYDPPDPRLTQAIYSLKESLRLPLLMRYMEEYSIAEIAAILQLPATLVKNRLFRARRQLAKQLEQTQEEDRP